MAGTLLGGLALYTEYESEKQSGEFNKRQSELNARISDLQAEDALARGREVESQSRADTKQLIGRQRAAAAAQGVDVSSGSAADIQADTAALGELDALTIRNNAAREAWGHRVGAIDKRLAGDLEESASRSRRYGSVLRFGASAFDRYDRRNSRDALKD